MAPVSSIFGLPPRAAVIFQQLCISRLYNLLLPRCSFKAFSCFSIHLWPLNIRTFASLPYFNMSLNNLYLMRRIILSFVPILSLSVSAISFSIALHSSNPRFRLVVFPFFLISSIVSFSTSKYFWFAPSLASLWSLGLLLYIVHITSVLYIEKLHIPSSSSSSPKIRPHVASMQFWSSKLQSTYRIWGNPQLLPVCSTRESQPLLMFCFLRVAKLPLYYLLHTYIIPSLFSETIFELYREDVGPTQQTFIRRVNEITAREFVVRSYTALAWIFESVIFLDSANSILAIGFVTIGLDRPSDWPSLFGSPTSATTLRNFWCKFWHKLAVRAYSNFGKGIANTLGLKPKSLLYNTMIAFVVFTLSGLSHAAVSWQVGHTFWYLDIWWFFLNFAGCFVETCFLSCLRGTALAIGWSDELKMIEESWLGNFVSYAWVFGFFFWSTPKWKFPGLYKQSLQTARIRAVLEMTSLMKA